MDADELNDAIMKMGLPDALVRIPDSEIQQRRVADAWNLLQLAFQNFEARHCEELNRMTREHGRRSKPA